MDNFRDSYFQINWDLGKKRLNNSVWGKQYDTGRGLSITLINSGVVVTPSTEVIRLKWEKPDKTVGYVNSTIVGGKFIIENIDQMFTVAGMVKADLELQVAGEFVASVTFFVAVDKAIGVDAIESSSEFTALQSAMTSFASKTELAVESSRITNLATLATGSTTGDAELIDARVGADGVTYPNVGGANRSQFTSLANDLKKIKNKQYTSNATLNSCISDCKVLIKNQSVANVNVQFYTYAADALFRVYKYDAVETPTLIQLSLKKNYYEPDKLFTYIDNDVEIYMILDWSQIATTLNGRFEFIAYADSILFDGKGYPNDKNIIVKPVSDVVTLSSQMELRNAVKGIYLSGEYQLSVYNGMSGLYQVRVYSLDGAILLNNTSFDIGFIGVLPLGIYGYVYIDTTKLSSLSVVGKTKIRQYAQEENAYLYSLVNGKPVFYCGANREIKTLKKGIEIATRFMDATLYVDDGIYDLVQEFGSAYFEALTSAHTMSGLKLKNRVRVVFSPNSRVISHYAGSNQYALSLFSPFNAFEYGFTLENLNLECSRCRYGIHDERNGAKEHYVAHYKNCHIKIDDSIVNPSWAYMSAVGGGFGSNAEVIYENCILERSLSNNRVGYYHQSNDNLNPNHKFIFRFINNYTINGSFGIDATRTDATEDSDILVAGNSFQVSAGTDAQGFYTSNLTGTNLTYKAWNNEIR